MTKAAPSRTSATSMGSMASMMAVGGILMCCRCGFDGARLRVSPLEFGHQSGLAGASGCGSGATSMKHCDGLID